ncbi:UNVERIFIED_CONTAM: hypothetical protein RMT77_007493 [Armadillidium vulgare]
MSLRSTLHKIKNQENLQHVSQNKSVFGGSKLNKITKTDKIKSTFGVKRKNDENSGIVAKKRSACADVTNALEKNMVLKAKANSKMCFEKQKSSLKVKNQNASFPSRGESKENVHPENMHPKKTNKHTKNIEKPDPIEEEVLEESILVLSQEMKMNKISLEESSAYITASEESPSYVVKKHVENAQPNTGPPPDVEDFDKACDNDPFSVSHYAMDIFNYYKEREMMFSAEKYVNRQPDISKTMRSILVDWMVEVQESFELNHETLYLAVKLVDLYLGKVTIKKDHLQLVGATAIFVACKFDERTPPCIDDFLYICDDAYKRRELILLEIDILKKLKYDLGIPLSYRFLRRYARAGKINMEILTFARYILERSLLEYDFIEIRDSITAAAALFIALAIKNGVKEWSATLQYYSGYVLDDFYHVVHMLHEMLRQPPKDHLKTIKNKYSHKIFHEVAKIPIPDRLAI